MRTKLAQILDYNWIFPSLAVITISHYSTILLIHVPVITDIIIIRESG